MPRGKRTPIEQQQTQRLVVKVDPSTERAFKAAAAKDGVHEVTVWLKMLGKRRVKRLARGATSVGALRERRDQITRDLDRLFSDIVFEEEREDVAAAEDDE